ncbi:hypothetical protein SCHPADRAFT_234 [Schizopora paradoxa]|uniref:Uncharacterized protein n=1 Tax=Schizopora paradoxa TaxID=27342 RepID=A0A0H2S7S5_9AGAM|nr:hypothetical protein SCHPADRAFT_234 [Schizopora paradoxa]
MMLSPSRFGDAGKPSRPPIAGRVPGSQWGVGRGKTGDWPSTALGRLMSAVECGVKGFEGCRPQACLAVDPVADNYFDSIAASLTERERVRCGDKWSFSLSSYRSTQSPDASSYTSPDRTSFFTILLLPCCTLCDFQITLIPGRSGTRTLVHPFSWTLLPTSSRELVEFASIGMVRHSAKAKR